MADSFTHLHVHTEYSMLDGAARVGDVVAAAAADGQPAIGITDHGNMYGVLDFYKACQRRRASSRSSAPSSTWPTTHRDRAPAAARGQGRRLRRRGRGRQEALLPPDPAGRERRPATRTSSSSRSRAFLEGYYCKPKVDWELLEEHTRGRHRHHRLPRRPRAAGAAEPGRRRRAARRPAGCRTSSGGTTSSSRSRTTASPSSTAPTRSCSRSPAHRAPLLATNDSHYIAPRRRRRPRRPAVRADRLADERPRPLQVPRRRALPEDGGGDAPPVPRGRGGVRQLAVDRRAGERRDRVRQAAAARTSRCPRASTDDADYLRAPHLRGGQGALGRRSCPTRSSSGSPTSSRSSATWGSARTSSSSGTSSSTPATPTSGSARAVARPPGCAVAYCLRITDLDPIKYDLLFERFLNPSRISMPDIDMDFDSRYRDEMIRYAAERYGRDHVAQIVTFSTIKARAAVRDAARVLGYPYAVGDKVAKAMPPLVMGRDTPLYACLEEHPKYEDGYKMAADLRDMYDDRPRRQAGHRRRQGPRGPAPPGRHPRRRGGDHQGPAHRLPADPAQAGGRPGPRGRAGRHPVRDARRRGPRPAQDGLPRPAQPRRHRRHARAHRARPAAIELDIDDVAARRPAHLRAAAPGRLDRRVPARGRRHARPHAVAGARPLRGRRRPRRPVPARARWRRTCTTTTPTARTAASRSTTSTPTPRRSSATPTG